jgi:hypothetical protein
VSLQGSALGTASIRSAIRAARYKTTKLSVTARAGNFVAPMAHQKIFVVNIGFISAWNMLFNQLLCVGIGAKVIRLVFVTLHFGKLLLF